MEGTRTPGLLIRRNPEAIFIHSEFYDDSQFLTFCRYFRTSLPLYSLHCLHLCASIFQFSDVQKMCKNVQRLLMLEKLELNCFYRQWILRTFHFAQFHFLHDSKLHHQHRFSGKVWDKKNGLPPCVMNRPILCGQYKKEACKG